MCHVCIDTSPCFTIGSLLCSYSGMLTGLPRTASTHRMVIQSTAPCNATVVTEPRHVPYATYTCSARCAGCRASLQITIPGFSSKQCPPRPSYGSAASAASWLPAVLSLLVAGYVQYHVHHDPVHVVDAVPVLVHDHPAASITAWKPDRLDIIDTQARPVQAMATPAQQPHLGHLCSAHPVGLRKRCSTWRAAFIGIPVFGGCAGQHQNSEEQGSLGGPHLQPECALSGMHCATRC